MRSNQKKNNKTTNNHFRHPARHLNVGFRGIILQNILFGEKSVGMETRRRKQAQTLEQVHLSLEKHWIKAMEEELSWIVKNETWELVPRPKDKNVIGTKWVFKNKLNEDGQVTRNTNILVCKGYAQVEGVDFKETFAPVARMEEIIMILDYECSKRIKVYQMDVKSTFLNGGLEEEVYIEKL